MTNDQGATKKHSITFAFLALVPVGLILIVNTCRATNGWLLGLGIGATVVLLGLAILSAIRIHSGGRPVAWCLYCWLTGDGERPLVLSLYAIVAVLIVSLLLTLWEPHLKPLSLLQGAEMVISDNFWIALKSFLGGGVPECMGVVCQRVDLGARFVGLLFLGLYVSVVVSRGNDMCEDKQRE